MMEEAARVIDSQDGWLELETKVASTCSSCEQVSSCGTGVLARYLSPKPEQLRLPYEESLAAGSWVKIGMSEHALLILAGLTYLMPIIVLCVSAVLASSLFSNSPEWVTILASLGATAMYFVLLRNYLKNLTWSKLEPRIIGIISSSEHAIDVKTC